MARKTLKTSARNAKASAKVRTPKTQNPFTRLYAETESKSAQLFKALTNKRGANLVDLADELGSTLNSVRTRVNQLKAQGFKVEKLGDYGDATYRLVG